GGCIVRRILTGLCLLALLAAVSPAAPQKGKEVATDPEKAGPDFAVQGEYVGETSAQAKLGAEVVARGNGEFLVNFLPGGLRGEGGDYQARAEAIGKTEGSTTQVASKDGKWNAVISSGKMTGKTAEGQDFTLEKFTRKSKSLGLKPPAGAVVLF